MPLRIMRILNVQYELHNMPVSTYFDSYRTFNSPQYIMFRYISCISVVIQQHMANAYNACHCEAYVYELEWTMISKTMIYYDLYNNI